MKTMSLVFTAMVALAFFGADSAKAENRQIHGTVTHITHDRDINVTITFDDGSSATYIADDQKSGVEKWLEKCEEGDRRKFTLDSDNGIVKLDTPDPDRKTPPDNVLSGTGAMVLFGE